MVPEDLYEPEEPTLLDRSPPIVEVTPADDLVAIRGGLSQAEVAGMAGVSQKTISNFERGEPNVGRIQMRVLLSVYTILRDKKPIPRSTRAADERAAERLRLQTEDAEDVLLNEEC